MPADTIDEKSLANPDVTRDLATHTDPGDFKDPNGTVTIRNQTAKQVTDKLRNLADREAADIDAHNAEKKK